MSFLLIFLCFGNTSFAALLCRLSSDRYWEKVPLPYTVCCNSIVLMLCSVGFNFGRFPEACENTHHNVLQHRYKQITVPVVFFPLISFKVGPPGS